MFYKVMCNNMVIDLLTEVRWVRYLPLSKRIVGTDSQSANGVIGSDHNTIYHLTGKPYTFNSEVKSVDVVKIDEVEYGRLQTQFALQRQENAAMKNEISSLKAQLDSQNELLQQILNKLG